MFELIDEKKKEIGRKRPLSTNTVKSIREKLNLDWTYNSNAIEGNTLTLVETKVVLEGITVGGKSMREHLEVINHKDAILYVEDIVNKEEQLSQIQIKNIHKLVLKGVNDEYAGRYRSEDVIIAGAEHIPPNHFKLVDEMEKFMEWYWNEGINLHPVERAARVHVDFVKIHPFIDGNGRTARLLLNLELLKEGYPPIIIRNEDRVKYYNLLYKAHIKGDYEEFISLVAEELEKSLDLYLKLIN
ncbi:Fic/DOC family protein [Natranaerovirga hydrolytica]|uniref:Fic/DOC family protein n=1 Tax=Natranaerovirga hydrolytica TaxID=680378 RepID=A0A4R1MLD5_9FIRM|nr:Fic family protein [Natranaerovirga hydrolytica]TCK92662.1 Fic/DOC family protein [Natranaerovirga hydrolytica]